MSTTTSSRTRAKQSRPGYRCTECGWTTPKWVGRCGECQEWGTVTDEGPASAGPRTVATSPGRAPARPIGDIDVAAAQAAPTQVPELD
ncbi:DNA repair protein RadA, partial [Isoptericola sp. QY 916]|nr:DNA repair protein RadA [Isoptericola sp. QY 916]